MLLNDSKNNRYLRMRQQLKELKNCERRRIVDALRAVQVSPEVQSETQYDFIGLLSCLKTLEPTRRSLQLFFKGLHAALLSPPKVGPARLFLQRLVLTLFTGVHQLPLYEQLIPYEEEHLLTLLRRSREWLHAQGAIKKGYNIRYILQQPGQLFKIFKGMRLGALFLSWLSPYDPRKTENYSTHLFDEDLPQGRAIYVATPTPTIGNDVRPEALVALEAIREGLVRPTMRAWLYVNLQHRKNWQERFRTKNIMQLNQQFAGYFFGCTLDVNSHFYRYTPITSHEDLVHWLLDDQVIDEASACSNYFPIPLEEWPAWKRGAEKKLRALPLTIGSVAIKEIALLVLFRHFQEYVFSKLPLGSEVLTTVACKECIDRGGKMNAEILWSSPYLKPLQGTKKVSATVAKNRAIAAIFFGRALFARKRMVQPHRADAFLELLERVPCCKVSSHGYIAY